MRLQGRSRAPSKQPDGRARRESGQALLELALVTPILVILVMAIFQFAFVMQSQNGLYNALREAARRAAATTTEAPTWTGSGSLEQWVQAQLCGSYVTVCGDNPSDRGLLAANVQAFDGTKLWTNPNPPNVVFCTYSAAGQTQYQVNIDLKYKHPLFFGPLAFATDLTDGTSNGYWDLDVAAQMRLENIDPDAAGSTGVTC